jgi:integrase
VPTAHMIGPGRWKVRVYVGDGNVRARTFDAATEAAMRKKLPRIITAIEDAYAAEARDTAARASYRDTVAGLVDDWEIEQRSLGRSPSYIERNRLICDRIRRELGKIPIVDLSPADCNNWYRSLRTLPGRSGRGQMSEATVMRHHRVLDAMLRMAEAEDRIVAAPTRRARKPKPLEHDVDLVPDKRMVALLDTLPARLRVCVELDAATGLRRGELLGLRWGDVDLDGRSVRVRNNTLWVGGAQHDRIPKGKRTRDVPLTNDATAMLVAWRAELESVLGPIGPDVRLFPDLEADITGHTPRRPDWLTQAWARHCRRHGEHVRLHDLRHWYASRLLDRGVPVTDVSAALGHAQMSTTTDIYGHARRDHDRIRAALDG